MENIFCFRCLRVKVDKKKDSISTQKCRWNSLLGTFFSTHFLDQLQKMFWVILIMFDQAGASYFRGVCISYYNYAVICLMWLISCIPIGISRSGPPTFQTFIAVGLGQVSCYSEASNVIIIIICNQSTLDLGYFGSSIRTPTIIWSGDQLDLVFFVALRLETLRKHNWSSTYPTTIQAAFL